MSRTYIVGRSAEADIRISKEHDAVGKRHLQIEEAGAEKVRVTDLKSTNGTFVRNGPAWTELKESRTVGLDTELMLGDFQTTPRKLLARLEPETEQAPKVPPPLPAKKRSGLRRNEFGEIVSE